MTSDSEPIAFAEFAHSLFSYKNCIKYIHRHTHVSIRFYRWVFILVKFSIQKYGFDPKARVASFIRIVCDQMTKLADIVHNTHKTIIKCMVWITAFGKPHETRQLFIQTTSSDYKPFAYTYPLLGHHQINSIEVAIYFYSAPLKTFYNAFYIQ